jgi:hypothetical protein
MASTIFKKPCSKCNKGMGILTCDGCQQSFCSKHIINHRQELSIQMDNIGQEYDLFRRDLMREDKETNPLLNRINLWEQESIKKIQQIAQQARNDLQEYFDQNKSQIKSLFNKLVDEIQSSRQSEDYTEIDFKLWIEQLTSLRKTLEKPSMIDIVNNDKTLTPIHMIKVKEKIDLPFPSASAQALDHNILTTGQSNFPVTKIFNIFVGDATFSENSLIATHSGNSPHSTMVYVAESYSSGIHRIRFRIERKTNKYLFFGIINSLEQMNRTVFNSPSLYGWMAPDLRVVKSRKLLSANVNTRFNEGEEILLTLNCNIQQILLEHQQTNTIDRLPIDFRVCPLPWRVVVAFFSRNDSVRIIH